MAILKSIATAVAPSTLSSLSSLPDVVTPLPVKDPTADKLVSSVVSEPSSPSGPISILPMSPTWSILPVISGKDEFSPSSDSTISTSKPLRVIERETKNFDPLGDVSGISAQQPVLIAATQFEPLFSKDALLVPGATSFTQAGKQFVDLYFSKTLTLENIQRIIDTTSSETKAQISQLSRAFYGALARSLSPVFSLASALKSLESVKNELDFDKISSVSSTTLESLKAPIFKTAVATRDVTSANITELFTSDLKFSGTSVPTFANTKIYLQMAYELQHIARNFSYDFIKTDFTQHVNDSSKTNIIKNFDVSPKFSSGFLERFSGIKLTQTDLVSLFASSDKEAAYRRIQASLKFIRNEFPTNIVEKIQLLCLLLSREFRASAGLANTDFQNRLSSYGFDASSTSKNILEQVVGDVPDTITDVILAQSNFALTSVAQLRVSNSSVLPFETKYIDSSNGTYTPGSTYLIDSIFGDTNSPLDTTRLTSFGTIVSSAYSSLSDVLVQLGFIDTTGITNPFGLSRSETFFFRIFSELLRAAMSKGDLSAGLLVGTQNEILVSTFAAAASDDVLRSYVFALLWDAGEAEIDALIDVDAVNRIFGRVVDIMGAVRVSTTKTTDGLKKTPTGGPSTKAGFVEVISGIGTATQRDVSEEEFRMAFSSSEFVALKKLFSDLVAAFVSKRCYNDSDSTRFSRIGNTVIKMLISDLFCCIMSRFMSSKFRVSAAGNLQVESSGEKIFAARTVFDKLTVAPDIYAAIAVSYADEIDAIDTQLRQSFSKLFDEEIVLKKIYICLANVLSSVKKTIDAVAAQFVKGTGVHARLYDDIANVIDAKYIGLLDAQQIKLAIAKTADVLSRVANGRSRAQQVIPVDDCTMSLPVLLALGSLLSEKRFQTSEGGNVRIISVGLPAGFSRALQQKTSTKKDGVFASKEDDIIKIHVFKRDVSFPEIIFKPLTFDFELSRFVMGDSAFEALRMRDAQFMSFSELVKLSRTLDISDDAHAFDTVFRSDDGDLFKSEDYDFLTQEEKLSLKTNHITSYLFGQYIKHISGVDLSEGTFFIDEALASSLSLNSVVLKSFVDKHIAHVAKVDSFDSATDLVSSLPISTLQREKIAHDVRHIAALGFMKSNCGDPDALAKEILTPKQFERVFNVAIDSDDFIIDIEKTKATKTGTSALDTYIASGDISHVDTPTGEVVYTVTKKERYRDEAVLEQYFVAVSTRGDVI